MGCDTAVNVLFFQRRFCLGPGVKNKLKLLCYVFTIVRFPCYPFNENLVLFTQAKSQFKRRSTANNVEIQIPVPIDADSPKFKVRLSHIHCRRSGDWNIFWTVYY